MNYAYGHDVNSLLGCEEKSTALYTAWMKHFYVLGDSLMSLPGDRTHLAHSNVSPGQIKPEIKSFMSPIKHTVVQMNNYIKYKIILIEVKFKTNKQNRLLKIHANAYLAKNALGLIFCCVIQELSKLMCNITRDIFNIIRGFI